MAVSTALTRSGKSQNTFGSRLLPFAIPLFVGLAGGYAAGFVGSKSTKVVAAFLAVLAAASLFLIPVRRSISSGEKLRWMAVIFTAAFALAMPHNLDVNFLYRYHVGGAPGITVNAAMLTALALTGVWVVQHATGQLRPLFRLHPLLVAAFMVLIGANLLSFVNASHIDLALLGLVRLLTLGLIMLVAMNIRDYTSIRVFVFFWSVSVIMQGGIAALQHATGSPLGLAIFGEKSLVEQNIGVIFTRASGTIGHPNIFGYFMEISLPVMLAYALSDKLPGRMRLWYLFALAVGLFGLFTTLSRGAWLTLPVSFTLVYLLTVGRRFFTWRNGVVLFLIGIVGAAALTAAWPTIEKRFSHSDFKSSASRMPLNEASFSIVRQYPLTGVGLNNFAETFKVYDVTGKSRIFKGYQHVVHNWYLWILTETGIIGLLAYLGLFAAVFFVCLQILNRGPPGPEEALVIGLAVGLLAHLLHCLVSPGFKVAFNILTMVYFLFGLLGAISLISRSRQTQCT